MKKQKPKLTYASPEIPSGDDMVRDLIKVVEALTTRVDRMNKIVERKRKELERFEALDRLNSSSLKIVYKRSRC